MSHLTRQETLTVLAATGIEFPPATKLPDDALRKRLQQALNGAQSASRVLKGALLDPATLSQWSNSRAHESMGRNNLLEAYQLSQGMEVPLYENPMLDARQTVMGLEGVGRWVQVGTDTRPSATGCYMRESASSTSLLVLRI